MKFDELLTTEEDFEKIFKEQKGFSSKPNSNHPAIEGLSFSQILEEGSTILVEHYPKLVGVNDDQETVE